MTKRNCFLIALIAAASGGITLAWRFSDSEHGVNQRDRRRGGESLDFKIKEKYILRKRNVHDSNSIIGIDLISQTVQKGDFKKLALLLEKSTNPRRFEIFVELLKRNDVRKWDVLSYYDAVSKLIARYGGNDSEFLSNCLFENLSSELNEETILQLSKTMKDEEWTSFAKSISRVGPQNAFFLNCKDSRIDSSRHDILLIEATRAWLNIDSVSASRQISSMSNGRERDLASCEMISWLISRNDGATVSAWLNLIDDENIHAKASTVIDSYEIDQSRNWPDP